MAVIDWLIMSIMATGASLITISIGFASATFKCDGELLSGIVVSTALWFLVYTTSPFTIGLVQ